MALNYNPYSRMTLKDLLENPDLQRAPAALGGVANSKDRKGDAGSGDIDFTSAFLGPQLWDKTYSEDDFNLEYMDLDEFLCENGIPVVDTPGLDQLVASPIPSPPPLPMRQDHHQISTPESPHASTSMVIPPAPVLMQPVPSISVMSADHIVVKPKVEKVESVEESSAPKPEVQAASPGEASTGSTPPASPLPVQVDFSLSEQDIALSSVPGQGVFDPTAHRFSEDELKPQPMMKKSRKVFVPDDMKDDKYWARRKKNNFAAKRSRDARRIKENQIAMRAAYLEKENTTLKEEMEKVLKENAHLKHRLRKYEPPNSST